MAYYSEAWLDEVRLRSDLVEIVGEHVALRQNGRRHVGLCPFHAEKTPSFSVDAEKQLYYCFGCHAGGNVFRFVMETEHMDFPEAARYLAERAHIPIPEEEARAGPSREVKDRLYAALTEAARWFNARLYAKEGASALAYLHGRGLGDNTIRRFGLGATGEGWDHLTRALEQAGFTQRELEDANLALTRGERTFDMFRSRAMFPIFDVRGRVVAFGGRILGEGQPKYLNSSDTPVFQKGRTVYGLNFIKGNPKRLYLVEGYMDVVSLRQHGVEGAVASLGTALTSDQARLLKRKVGDGGEIVIVYDGDNAGIRAAKRAIDIFAMNGVDCKVARIPGGQDPDDFIRANGGQAFGNLPLLQSREYLLGLEKERFDLSTLEGRTAYATEAAKIIRTLDSPVVVENYVKTLAVETGFPKEVLYEQIGRTPKVRLSAQAAGNTRPQYRDTIKDTEPPDHVKAQQRLLSLIAAGYEHKHLPIGLNDFTDPLCREMAGEILAGRADGMTASRMLDSVEDDLKRRRMLAILSLEESIESERTEELIESYVRTIRRNALEERSRELAEEIGNPANSASVAQQLLREQMEITRQLSRLDTYFRQLRP